MQPQTEPLQPVQPVESFQSVQPETPEQEAPAQSEIQTPTDEAQPAAAPVQGKEEFDSLQKSHLAESKFYQYENKTYFSEVIDNHIRFSYIFIKYFIKDTCSCIRQTLFHPVNQGHNIPIAKFRHLASVQNNVSVKDIKIYVWFYI